jgi:hypothetical protein
MENRLPPVILDSTEIAQPGSVAANQSLNAAVRILEQTRSDAMLRIAKIEIDRSSNIWLNMKAGIRINFGRCEDVDKKVTLMRSLLSHDRENRFAELNVSSPDWPAGRLREPPKHGSPEEVAAAPSNAQDTPLDRASRTISSRTRPGTH